jgi:pimeloyl-ACP methyl ester carboxylesterase
MPLLGLYREVVRRRYETPTRADEVHRVLCADGVRVAVKRFRPAPGAPPRGLPVLCVPGLGADSTNFDAPAPCGLGPWLAEQGFDTWVVDLRGTGLSTVEPGRWASITFDDHVALDMPAVLEHIAASTGVPQALWVGHSMGGLLLYALLATGRGSRVRAGITLGSPLGFPQGWDVVPWLKPLRGFGDIVPGLHVAGISQLLVPLALRFDNPMLRRFLILENVDPAYARRLMYRAIQSIPRGLVLQFRDWIEHDAFRSADRALDYRARLAGARTPVLVIGAPLDGLARIDAVRRALPLLPRGEYALAGKEGGLSTDYGHIDVLFGRAAHVEIFPRLRAFLESQLRLADPRAERPGAPRRATRLQVVHRAAGT